MPLARHISPTANLTCRQRVSLLAPNKATIRDLSRQASSLLINFKTYLARQLISYIVSGQLKLCIILRRTSVACFVVLHTNKSF